MAFSSKNIIPIGNYLLIRVYKGGDSDHAQGTPFTTALEDFQQQNPKILLKVEYLNCDQLKRLRWTVKKFIDWLIGPGVFMHFVIGHIHQGLVLSGNSSLPWNLAELYNEVLRLADHKGFPTGDQVKCPMLTQDKFEYLGPLLDVGMANPSLRIPFTHEDDDFEYLRDSISELYSNIITL
jgi:hypothetical protein